MAHVVVGRNCFAQVFGRLLSGTALKEAADAANPLLQFGIFKLVNGVVHHPIKTEIR